MLQAEPTPALNLPPSPLVAALVDDVNSVLAKFVEEQTPNSFIPLPLKRQRRYYRVSEPTFPGPYAVPPGLVSLTLDKMSEPKKLPVLIPHSLVSSFETVLSGVSEATSWFDWWLSTMSTFSESLPDEARVDFVRLIVSGSKVIEFLGSQAIAALGNLVLLCRDSLLTDVRSTVPAEELSRLRHATLPTSVALFPPNLLDTALSKTRAASNDALVHKALHPLRIPRRPTQGQGRASSASTPSADRSDASPLLPLQQQALRYNPSPSSLTGGKSNKPRKGNRPFSKATGRSGSSGGKRKGSGKRPT